MDIFTTYIADIVYQIYQKLASFPLNCFSKLYPGLVRGTSFKNLQNKLQIFGTDNGSYRRRG